MDLLPALASSAANRLRESPALQSFRRRFTRRTMASPEVCWPLPMRAIGAQNLLTMPGGVSTSGYLHKKGGSQFSLMKWPLRYIIIHKGCVYYFKTSTSPSPQGAFSLNGYNRVMRAAEETTSSNVFPFKIIHFSKKHRTWFFSAASEEERRKWMRFLRREIDHYNDRRESHISSDSDSADSFYGSIERPMDIRHSVDNTEHDYMEDEDEEDEEDYLKPDSDCSPTSTGRATVPPPSYPPPPVPGPTQHRQDSSPTFFKGLPPPLPSPNKSPTSPHPKKPPPPFPPPSILRDAPNKAPPPPLPYNAYPQKPPTPSSSPAPPLPPPPNLKKSLQSRTATLPEGGADRRDRWPLPTVTVQSPATLPICNQLESRMVLDGPAHNSNVTGTGEGGHSPSSNRHRAISTHSNKPGLPLPPPPNSKGLNHAFTSPPVSPPDPLSLTHPSSLHHPPLVLAPRSPHLLPEPKPGPSSRLLAPKPPPPTIKPPSPTVKPPSPTIKPPLPPVKHRHRGPSNQRDSPDGQSFRSSRDEMPAGWNKRGDPDQHSGDDSDEDYENVHLPDSVFVDTTETCNVEKLFKESCGPPQDGLYCIRNSGTKTSKVLVVWDVSLGKARNYRLFEEESRVFLDIGMTFLSLAALVEHYYTHPLPNHGSLCLQQPYGYSRPR